MRSAPHYFLLLLLSMAVLLPTWPNQPAVAALALVQPAQPANPPPIAALLAKAQSAGTVQVIVGLALPLPFAPEGTKLSAAAVQAQRNAIATQQTTLLTTLAGQQITPYAQFRTVPYLALEVDAAALSALQRNPAVVSLQADRRYTATLASSTALIGAPKVWANGDDGSDQMVAILDTGIDATHPFFGERVGQEACFSNANGRGQGTTLCPNGQPQQSGAGAADANTTACLAGGEQLCSHGSHVAGIAAGHSAAFAGVAPGATIVPIQVFTRLDDEEACAFAAPCVAAYTTDLMRALEHVLLLHESLGLPIAAVNLSLGGGEYADQATCDAEEAAIKALIDQLRSVKIATVIASGNDALVAGLGAPACISSAVAVGATNDQDQVAPFSNQHDMVDLLAPGVEIDSAIPGGGFANYQGTSMAAPHVTGAWAVLKQIQPEATVTEIMQLLRNTGRMVRDTRVGGTTRTPRIQLDSATAMPELATITPAAADPGRTLAVTITATATHFVADVTTADFGAGIAVKAVTVNSSSTAVIELTIAADAAPGARRVVLTTGTEIVSKAAGFTVNASGPAPVITRIEPDNGDPGATLQVRIVATATHFVAGKTTADFGPGITVEAVTVTTPSALTVAVKVADDTTAGERTVRVTTGAEIVEQARGFRVNIPVPPTGHATLYFDPAPITMTVSETRSIALVVSPGNTPINGVMINGQVDPTYLRLLDVRRNQTQLGETLAPLTFDPATGNFQFGAGVLGSTVTEPFTVISLTVVALTPTVGTGTPLTFLTTDPATDIAGPSPTGSVMEEARNGLITIVAQGGRATLVGKVDLQGRAAARGDDWMIPLTVELLTSPQVAPLTFYVTSDQQGRFTLADLPTGGYSIRVKGEHTLGNQINNVTLRPGLNELFLGTLREGDVETDTSRNRTVLRDFGQLSGAFHRCRGETGYVPTADLNEQDGCVTIADFALLSANFNTQGWIVYDNPEVVAAPLPLATADAQLSFGEETRAVATSSTIALPLWVDPRQGDAVAGVTIHLRFDPTLVAVTAITPTAAFPVVLAAPTVDPVGGTLRFSVATNLGQHLSSRTQLATLQVQLLGQTDGTAITPVTDRPTDTAVAGAAGNNILTAVAPITLRSNVNGNNTFELFLPVVMQ